MSVRVEKRDILWIGLLTAVLVAARQAPTTTGWQYQFLTDAHLNQAECMAALPRIKTGDVSTAISRALDSANQGAEAARRQREAQQGELCSRNNMTARLDAASSEGWELVGCFLQPSEGGRQVTCYSRRPTR